MIRAMCLVIILYIVHANCLSDRKSSLTFVIDVTKSMKPVIVAVESQAAEILDALTNSNESYIDHFVLVTFADPENISTSVTNVTDTYDKFEFEDSLSLHLVSGGDCPEYSMSGIQAGIEHSAPGSTMYVFTDASASDHKSYDYVKYIALKKEIQIIFVLTGECNRTVYPYGYMEYPKLAGDTSGQVFNVSRDNVSDILQFVKASAVARRIVLAVKLFKTGHSNTFYYTTDHATKDTMISVACTDPKVNVSGSDSDKLDIIHLVNQKHVAVLKVNEPKTGTYAVTIDCESSSRTMVTARSSIHFEHGFSTFQPLSLDDTTSQPIPGNQSYLAIKIDGEFEPQTVKLLDVDDNVISNSTMSLKVIDNKQKFYTTEPFNIEAPVFRIVLTGIDLNYNTTITRVGTLLQQQNISEGLVKDKAPKVSINGHPQIIVEYDSPGRLKCSVHAYPKPQIIWKKDGATLEKNVYYYELPYDFVSLYEIEKVNENATYTCKATNKIGDNTQTVLVTAKPKLFFDVVTRPSDLTIQYNKTDKIKCIVNSYPPADIVWSKTGKASIKDDGVILSDDGLEMTIQNMQPAHEGNYKCEVNNGIKKITFPFKVNISGLVEPKIEKSVETIITILENSNINISCRIEEGIPSPTIQWFHKNKISGIFDEVTGPKNQENYRLQNINRKDEGIYMCFIENILGNDTMEVTIVVEYEPILYDIDEVLVSKRVGQEVILTCKADGVPDPTISWTKDGKHIRSSKFVSGSDHRLIFDADLYDTGTYNCSAKNYLGVVSKSIYVEVESPPKVVINSSDPVDVPYNESITLTCEVFGYPKPDIIWKDISSKAIIDAEIEDKSPYHFVSNITIDQVITTNSFQCIANTAVLSDNKTVTVKPTTYFEPKIIPKDTTHLIEFNSTYELLCIVKSMPFAEVNWYKNGTLLAKDDLSLTPDDAKLTIQHMEFNHTGSYKCEIKHMNNTYTYPFNIQITGVEKPKIFQLNTSYYVPESSHLNISCRIEKGIPKPVIRWYRKDIVSGRYTHISDIADNESVVLHNIHRNETGNYKCVATNEIGDSSMETNVIVQYPPSIDNDLSITVQAGNKAELKCVSDGVPKPNVTWTKDKSLLSETKYMKNIGDSLTFEVDLFDSGDYTCNATNILGYSSKIVALKVEKLPNVTITGKDPVDAEYNATLTLTCEVYGFPKPDIIWTDSIKTELKTELNEQSPFHFFSYLNIENVTKNDTYRCKANNTLGDNDKEITVLTVRKPYYNVLKHPRDEIYRIGYGENHIFTCKIDAYPPVAINWYKNEKILAKDNLSISSDGSELAIKGMQLVDAGYFKCEAEHLNVTYTYPFEIHITGVEKPKISDYHNMLHLSEHSEVEIICRVEKGIPKPSIQWLYKDTITSTFKEITYNKDKEHLSLKNISRKDSGTYKCIATNDMGDDMMVTELVVEYAPYIDNDFLPVTVKVDESIVLKCLAYGIPEPTVLWTKDDKPLTDLKVLKSSNNNLNFIVKLTDAGDYACIATNVLGSSNKTLTLKVVMTPEVIIKENNPVTVKIDELLTLTCEVFGYPKPDIAWKNTIWKTKLKSDINEKAPHHFISYLKIDKATTQTYECEASNFLGIDSASVHVIAEKKPYFTILRTPKDTNIAYNSKSILHCDIDAYPPAVITWLKDSNLLTKRDNVRVSFDNGTLTFDNMQPYQQGTYICEADNGVEKKTFTAYVSMFEPPEIFKSVSEKNSSTRVYRFEEGRSAILTCKIHKGTPKPILKWMYEDNLTKSYSEIREARDQEYLFLAKVERNTGNYKCEANQYDDRNHLMGSDSLTMEMDVGYQPIIRPDNRTYVVKVRESVSVPCIVEGNPTPEVIWMRQGNSSPLPKTSDHTFRLETAKLKDNGTYICKATNEYGTSTRTVDAYIYMLKITNKWVEELKRVTEGDRLTLICNVIGRPIPHVMWFYNGTVTNPEIPGKLVGRDGEYTIESILYEQRGNYTCVAINYGCETLSFVVDVEMAIKIQNENSVIKAVDGDLALTIHCNATGNPIDFEWTLNGIIDSERSNTIVFKEVTSRISKSIVCRALGESPQNFDVRDFTIEVDEYPSLNNPNYTQKEMTGDKVLLRCPIHHKKGDLLRWYRDNKKIHDTELTFAKVKASDAGLYTCRISNYTSSESANVNLTVALRLEFINLVETNLSLKFEEIASLDCLTTRDLLSKVSWSYNGRVISIKPTKIYKFIMKHEYEGIYKCKVTDGTDTISRTFHVYSDECILNIKPNEKQPLILSPSHQLPKYNYSGGYLYMSSNQSFLLVCPSTGHLMSFADNVDYVYAYCKNSKLEIYNRPYAFADLSCSEEVKPHVEWTHKACHGEDSETIKIFYKLRSKKIEVYEICMENSASSFYVPVFTKHKLISPLSDSDSVPNHVTWFKDERRPDVDFDDLYNAKRQVNDIFSTLDKYETSRCVFSKRHLVNPLDMFPGVPQKASFTHLNVVPHWSTCNSENWDEVESRVRRLAKTNELTVWTGTAKDLNLPMINSTSEPILLTNSDGYFIVASTYMWKVVQDNRRASLAIVQLNVPGVTAASEYVKCKDICDQTNWMSGTHWHDVSKGYTFCCELKDFEDNFGFRGVFGATVFDNILTQ